MKKFGILGALLCAGASFLFADFSYEESTQITGGAMMSMMKIAGAFSKKAREPIRSTIAVKGDRMVRLTPESAQITDIGKETITEINFQKKTYSVMTFAQMKQMLDAASKKSQEQPSADVNYKASVKETGQRKQISGMDTKETILTLEMETTDPKTGKKGSMVVTSDMWLAPKMAGYEEVQSFYKRMAEKLNWTPTGNPFMGRSDLAKAMADVSKESAALDGVPVMVVTRMGGQGEYPPPSGGAQPSEQQPQAQQQTEPQPQSPSVSDAIGGKLGRLGGLGGFGRKKPKEQPQPQPQAQPSQPASGNRQAPADAGVLMESTTEMSGFSSAPVDPSKFEVPTGFKQVDARR